MSIESARAFVEKMRKDLEFKKTNSCRRDLLPRGKSSSRAPDSISMRMHLDSLVSELTPEERDALMLL